MSDFPFCKYESIGNDFVLIEERYVYNVNIPALARAICQRRLAVGSDGLLVVSLENTQPEIRMRMFNPDGSEDFCGNGLRCAALHARLTGKSRDRAYGGEQLTIMHGGFENCITFSPGGWIDVGLPRYSFNPQLVPLAPGVAEIFDTPLSIAGSDIRVCSLTTGSTHTVIFVDRAPADEEFLRVSPALERFEWFPQRTSVLWCWPLELTKLGIRIWERGVGETLGCGTGSAAAAACWFRKKPGLQSVGVMSAGGEAVVSKGVQGGLVVSAKARRVYEGRFAGEV